MFDIYEQRRIAEKLSSVDELVDYLGKEEISFEQAVLLLRGRFNLPIDLAYSAILDNIVLADKAIDRTRSDVAFRRMLVSFLKRHGNRPLVGQVDGEISRARL